MRNRTLLVSAELLCSIGLVLGNEPSGIPLDDPRWSLIEEHAEVFEMELTHYRRIEGPILDQALADVHESKVLIDNTVVDRREIIRYDFGCEYQISKYEKRSVRVDGDWAIVYETGEGRKIEGIPEFVFRKEGSWKFDSDVTWLIEHAAANPKFYEDKLWRFVLDTRDLPPKDFMAIFRLTKWLKNNFVWPLN